MFYFCTEIIRKKKGMRKIFRKSDNEIRNEQIADIIREIHRLHKDMSYRRIRDELAVNYGIPANDKRILRICRKIGIQSSIKWKPKS